MSAKSQKSNEQLWQAWDNATASFRASLTERSAAEMVYDEAVLASLNEGKSIRHAIERANALYPSEALELTVDNIGDVAEHYNCLRRMERIDEGRELLRALQEKGRGTSASASI